MEWRDEAVHTILPLWPKTTCCAFKSNENTCSDRSIEVKFPALYGEWWQTDRPTNRQTDMGGHGTFSNNRRPVNLKNGVCLENGFFSEPFTFDWIRLEFDWNALCTIAKFLLSVLAPGLTYHHGKDQGRMTKNLFVDHECNIPICFYVLYFSFKTFLTGIHYT